MGSFCGRLKKNCLNWSKILIHNLQCRTKAVEMNRSGKGLFKDEKDFNAWIANHKHESFKMRKRKRAP